MSELTEERIREIVREEIIKHTQRQVEIASPPHNPDMLEKLAKTKKVSKKKVVK